MLIERIFGARYRKAIDEVKKFGNILVSGAIDRKIKRGSAERPQISRDKHQSNLIDSLLDRINDRQIVADAAMNYLSAGQFR